MNTHSVRLVSILRTMLSAVSKINGHLHTKQTPRNGLWQTPLQDRHLHNKTQRVGCCHSLGLVFLKLFMRQTSLSNGHLTGASSESAHLRVDLNLLIYCKLPFPFH